MGGARAAAISAHAAAREADGPAARAARAAGHAAAAAHMAAHAPHAAEYAAKAMVQTAGSAASDVAADERERQYRRLPERLRPVVFPDR